MKRKNQAFLGIIGITLAVAGMVGALLLRAALPASSHTAVLPASASPLVDGYDHLYGLCTFCTACKGAHAVTARVSLRVAAGSTVDPSRHDVCVSVPPADQQ
jgi:hypothetical protein